MGFPRSPVKVFRETLIEQAEQGVDYWPRAQARHFKSLSSMTRWHRVLPVDWTKKNT